MGFEKYSLISNFITKDDNVNFHGYIFFWKSSTSYQ